MFCPRSSASLRELASLPARARHRPVHLLNLKLNHFEQLIVKQLIEDNDLVQTIDELRIECLAHLRHHHLFHLFARGFRRALETHRALLLNEASADVRSHDDDCVLEIDGVAERVGEQSIFKNLQQNVEDVGMRLFNFVKQQHRIGRAFDAFSELTTFLVPDVSRRRPINFETECFSMNSDMSKRIIARSLPNRNCASDRATSVLPTPVGPRNRNEPTGRSGFFKPARERRMARASAEIAGR